MNTVLKNCHLISPGVNCRAAAILVEDDRIVDCITGDDLPVAWADTTIDAAGQYVMPGFIDIHSHGALGNHVCDGTLEAIEKIAEHKLSEGVTTFCPGTVTAPEEVLVSAMKAVEDYRGQQHYAKVAGVHLEGPFLNPDKLGGQNPRFVQPPSIELVKKLNDLTPVKIVSLSPELPGSNELIRQLTEWGIIASAAHSAANYAEIKTAESAGLRHLTHFCNQMTPLHHRDIGAVGAGLLEDGLKIELICDKIHLCPEMIRLIFNCKPLDKIMLITDASYLSGLPDGEYELRGLKTEIRDGVIRLAGRDTLCGSGLRYNIGLKNVLEITGLPLEELVRTTSLNQALALQLDNVGRLEPGYLADIVILDSDFQVKQLLVDGIVKL